MTPSRRVCVCVCVGGGGGLPVPLFPWKKSVFSLVPQNQNFDFRYSLFPKIAFVPPFPSVLDFCSLVPLKKWPYSPVPQNDWEGLKYDYTRSNTLEEHYHINPNI